MQKFSFKYLWAILGSVAIIAVIVECVRRFVISDMNVWSGWGQWIGGIGALIAAYSALRISHKETMHRRNEERRRQFIDAHYLAVHNSCVKNWGTEPFVNIQVIQTGPKDEALTPVFGIYLPLLLPTGRWDFCELLETSVHGEDEFEIQYEDLAGRVWQKLDDKLPREISTDHPDWRPAPDSWVTTTPEYAHSS